MFLEVDNFINPFVLNIEHS